MLETGYNTYGYPGLIDMPAAHARPDGELAFTSSYFQKQLRNTLTFQITPRLSGSFRYANLWDINNADFRFDRSFSLHYEIATETRNRPAIAIGLNDFLGTGVYRSEYLAVSKTLTPRFRVTGGIGWGRFAGIGGFTNPLSIFGDQFRDRETRTGNQGGEVEVDQLFQGDAAFFGGLEYQATDKLSLAIEYSSDAYRLERVSTFDYFAPVNIGATYRLRPGVHLSAHYLYGSELGVQLSFALNPKNPPAFGGLDKGPPPVVPRPAGSARALGWTFEPENRGRIRSDLSVALAATGLELHGLSFGPGTARLEIENDTYVAQAQAIGRAARAMTGIMPASVDTFVIVPVVNGIAGSQITLRREDIEALESDLDGAWKSLARARIETPETPLQPRAGLYPRFEYDLKPYLSPSLFDPDQPVRADFGAELSARYEPAPGFVLKGAVRKKIVGNLDQSTRPSTSVLPRVRSEFNIYEREGDPTIPELVATRFFRAGPELYGRLTLGYLEPHFAGISSELLWKPLDSRLSLGLEVNYVRQREFKQLFGLRSYEIATGHGSAYYDFGNGFTGQLDVGRYLAGDWGATISLDRTFRNGWKIGGFATFTDVSFDDFGEGSFDKGIRITVPISWISGTPTRDTFSTTIRPVTRDGGARLNVSDRLHDLLNDTQKPGLRSGWGRFWR
ncbi:YjbH domain-containing protein [Aestuariicoccus sp. MJ-SS9]|uniref:YjbH domain-containing protein n=1 Tax=Aestuariicoccus sp. MJ-SS9 TaxID=3079855 RepID=UPI00291217E4|nr:YjbH domain-containing protein [Aestuariicoccus sp. MJ-SS9]MDU8914009.1 YjbH domain-containing protein [Aestuariicoccus sp. MJ-SS9]